MFLSPGHSTMELRVHPWCGTLSMHSAFGFGTGTDPTTMGSSSRRAGFRPQITSRRLKVNKACRYFKKSPEVLGAIGLGRAVAGMGRLYA